MKTFKQAFFAVVAAIFLVAPLVVGAAIGDPASPPPTSNGFNVQKATNSATGLTNKSVYDLLGTFMNWLLGIVGVLAVIAFVVSGIFYLTAAGDEDRIKTAKSIMLYAILGLTVALVGLVIVNAIAGLTGGIGASNF